MDDKTSMWRSHIHKSADLILEIPVGLPYWPTEMHKPLLMAFYFPGFNFKPWFCARTPLMEKIRIDWKLMIGERKEVRRLLKALLLNVREFKRQSAEQIEKNLMKTQGFNY